MKSKQITYRCKKAKKPVSFDNQRKKFSTKHLGEMSIIGEPHYIRKALKIDSISISNNDHTDTTSKKSVIIYITFKKEKKLGVILTNLPRAYKVNETMAEVNNAKTYSIYGLKL